MSQADKIALGQVVHRGIGQLPQVIQQFLAVDSMGIDETTHAGNGQRRRATHTGIPPSTSHIFLATCSGWNSPCLK